MHRLRRALSDTKLQMGSWSGILLLLAGPLSFLGAHYFLFGSEQMTEELNPVISGFAGLGVVVLTMLIWNFLAAPARIARDRIEGLESRVRELEVLNERRAQLIIDIRFTSHGGESGLDLYPVLAFIYVRNKGELPTSAYDWTFSIERKDGTIFEAPPDIADDITFSDLTVRHQDFIFEKRAPIAGGAIVDGYMLLMATNAEGQKIRRFRINCFQTDGTKVSSKWSTLGGEKYDKIPLYVPGMMNPFAEDKR